MKKFKKFLAILLVASMIFTTNAVNVFAEGMNANQEEQLNEETVETSEVETLVEADDETDEELTPGSEKESEEEFIEEEEEESVEANVHGARPEDEENSTEEKLGESEIELELDKKKKDDILYGDDPLVAYVYYIQYNDSTKKWEKKYETITQEDNEDEKVAALWNTPNTPFRNRFAIAYRLNPIDPSVPNLSLYNQFETTGSMYDQGSIIEEITNWKNADPKASLHICATFHKCKFYFFRLVPGESGAEKRYADCDEGKSDTEFNEYYEGKFNNIVSEGALGLYTFEAAEPMYPSDDDYNEYKTGDKEYECSLAGLKQAYDAWNDNPTKNICVGVMYTNPSAPTTYTVTYNQNLPSGYTLSDGKTWYSVATTSDLSGDPIKLEGSSDMTCEDTSGNVRTLEGWNTAAGGAGTPHAFGETINDDTEFTGDTLTLYAVWSEPVAPGPTTYTVTYNQNLPSGYSLSDGKTWYSVATTSDLSGHPIELKGSADMTCEDTSGNVRTLEGWNTVAELTGDKYNFGDKFSDASVFTSNPLTLYAIWSDPVAPGPAGSYIYWIVDGEGENKTIHYYNTDGTDRTKLEIGADGVVYKNLTKDDIKKAVIEEPIVATDARGFFQAFYELESIDNLTNLDTSNATSFEGMFSLCYKLDDINLSLFNTKKVTDTSSMFSSCSSLKSLTFGDNFDTSKVTNMAGMFDSCNSLTSITFGSNFKTNNVTNMRDMFCAVGLEKLDLTSFDTSKVTNMTNMFAQCGILKTIKVSDKFKVDQVTDSEYMFVECFNLVGGKGTLYDETTSPWDVKYAHIDEGPTNPGFFTAAPTPTPPTPPTPSPSPSYGGNTGGGDSSGGSTDGPIKVTNNNMLTYTVNNIPQSLLLNDPALYLQLMSYPENTYMQKTNAKDIYGNTGYGRWMRIPNTTTWYFYAGDFNGVGNAGFLKDGWFNLGWDGVDRWYHFDSNGVMQLGWFEENGKIYFLQNDLNDNWYGKAVTGTHVIDGVTYTFDSTGALIQ